MRPIAHRIVLFTVPWMLLACESMVYEAGIDQELSGASSVGPTSNDPNAPNNPANPNDPTNPNAPGPNGSLPPPSCDDDATTEEPLRRLSRKELDRTYLDLLGPDLYNAVELQIGAIPEDAAWAADGLDDLSITHVESLVTIADRVAEEVALGDYWDALDAPCMAVVTPSAGCVTSFVENFGLRIFRRPLTVAERNELVVFYTAGANREDSIQRLLMRLLLSPDFLFHSEVNGDLEGSTVALDDYGVANRISYRVLGSMPNAALFAAASAGRLSTQADVEAEVRALFNDPTAKARVLEFFEDWLRLEGIYPAPASIANREGIDAGSLRAAMIDETLAFVEHELWNEQASYSELLTSTNAFPADPTLAEIYEVPTWSEGSGPVQTGSERGGLLLRASMLVRGDSAMAPIMRGVFLGRRVLCDSLPSPDPTIIDSRLNDVDDGAAGSMSTREQINVVTSPASCQGCHSRINALAFPLEEFDAIGRFRTSEEVYDADDNVIASHAIDASASLFLDGATPVTINSAQDLVSAIASSNVAAECLAETLYQYSRVRESSNADQCGIDKLAGAVATGVPLAEIFIENIANDAILFRALEES